MLQLTIEYWVPSKGNRNGIYLGKVTMVTIYLTYSRFLLNYIMFIPFSYKAGETECVH